MKHCKDEEDIGCISTVSFYVFFFPLIACIVIFLCFMLSACTYSINLVHSQGSATDLIDENQTAQAKIDPTLQIPTGPIL